MQSSKKIENVFYAVKVGRKPGIYKTWKKCQEQTTGFKNSKFKKFDSEAEAKSWIDGVSFITPEKGLKNKRSLVNYDIEKKIVIFTDGSCICNGMPNASGGIGIVFPEDLGIQNISQKILENPTNNKAELTAIKEALFNERILSLVMDGAPIVIFTDSDYSIKSLTEYAPIQQKNNWRNSKGEKISNYDLIRPLYDLLQRYKNISLIHVYAHTGKKDNLSLGNNLADKLAYSAASGIPVEELEEANLVKERIFPFGKYKGKTIEYVIDEDKNYIDWCKKNSKMPSLVKYINFISQL